MCINKAKKIFDVMICTISQTEDRHPVAPYLSVTVGQRNTEILSVEKKRRNRENERIKKKTP